MQPLSCLPYWKHREPKHLYFLTLWLIRLKICKDVDNYLAKTTQNTLEWHVFIYFSPKFMAISKWMFDSKTIPKYLPFSKWPPSWKFKLHFSCMVIYRKSLANYEACITKRTFFPVSRSTIIPVKISSTISFYELETFVCYNRSKHKSAIHISPHKNTWC